MATRTKPLISAAALASAAAVAVATPMVAPNLSVPTPGALSRAAYNLTNFADVLSIPPVAITDILFGNTSWGGVLGPEQYGDESAKPQDAFGQYGYVNPWAAYCNYNCDVSGPSGVSYLIADALVNGNGEGYDNSDQWSIGIVNYLWEPNTFFLLGSGASPTIQQVFEGYSASTWYALQTTLGKALPALTLPLAAAYWGPNNVSVFYNLALTVAAGVVGVVPVVGPLIGNTTLAYLGDLSLEQGTQDTYQYGLSGALNYLIDVATGAVPWPESVPWYNYAAPPAAALAPGAARLAAAASRLAAPGSETQAVDTASDDTAAATETDAPETKPAFEAADDTPAAEAPQSTPEVEVAETKPAAQAPESTPEVEVSETKPEVEVSESTPEVEAPETKPEVEAPETKPAVDPVADLPSAEVADSAPAEAPAKASPKRPIRDAVEKAANQINSTIANAKAAQAERVAARKAKADAAD